jgi:hypothetical protein
MAEGCVVWVEKGCVELEVLRLEGLVLGVEEGSTVVISLGWVLVKG